MVVMEGEVASVGRMVDILKSCSHNIRGYLSMSSQLETVGAITIFDRLWV